MGKLGPWAVAWALDRAKRRLDPALPAGTKRHLLVALCDHYEPMWSPEGGVEGSAPREVALRRVRAWRERYPALASRFVDSDGMPPRHTFFFPGEQYDPELVEPLAELCALGFGECEVHLHHDGDRRETLVPKLEQTVERLSDHGLVPRQDGRARWAFIHGNWCLANSRRDGSYCGVDDELEVLHELGCYADFTFPSAPDETQPTIVNAIYYPEGDVRARRAHERGAPAAVGTRVDDRLLMVQGPLALAPRDPLPGGALRLASEGLAALRAPLRIDAAAVTAADPATPERLARWIDQHVHVRGRPEWTFIKLHTHGAPEPQAEALLGEPQRKFHEALAELRARGDYAVHYVTAREMYNIARAAMRGETGDPGRHRDFEIPRPARAG